MSSEIDYATEEWTLLRELPFKVILAAVASDVRGPIGAASKEMVIGARALVRNGTANYANNNLITGILRDVADDPADEAEIKLNDDEAREAVIVEAIALCENVQPILANGAEAAEADEYRAWIFEAARAVVAATSSGGFLGFGAVKVSDREQAFLDRLQTALQLESIPGAEA